MGVEATIGGQAVPHGVMLRGPAGWAVAVRRTDGEIAIAAEPRRRHPTQFWRAPFLRGLHAIATVIPLGVRSLDVADELRHPGSRPAPTLRQRAAFLASLAGALAVATLVFGLLPAWVASWVTGGTLHEVVEAVSRAAVIVLYIAAIGLIPDVRQVFAYHGAEHQVVAAHEFGVRVDAAVARSFPRFHPRCGTSFVVLVALAEGLLRAVVPLPAGPLWRFAYVCLAVMVAYELMHAAIRWSHRAWARVVLAPGRALQQLTTKSPNDAQLEVACAALHAVVCLGSPAKVLASEDQDQQQDDQDQGYESTTDVHRSSSVRVTLSFSGSQEPETSLGIASPRARATHGHIGR